MPRRTFASPEAAALDGFPPGECRVVASRSEGDDAYVLLDAGSVGSPYLYGSSVTRREGGWMEDASGNGPGWTRTGADGDLGTLAVWGEAPAGAERVRIAFGSEVREEPVVDGVYLSVWWRVPYPESAWPAVVGFHP